jgi:hypothetical protein
VDGLADGAFVVIPGDAGLSYLERQPEHHKAYVTVNLRRRKKPTYPKAAHSVKSGVCSAGASRGQV